MYKQVPTSLNFVDREKAVEKFWEDNNIFKKVWNTVRKARPIPSTTDRLPPTVSPTSVM